jgi:Ca-activated chloride channel family protein
MRLTTNPRLAMTTRVALFVALAGLLVTACTAGSTTPPTTNPGPAVDSFKPDPRVLNIVAGSEQDQVLRDIVVPWCQARGLTCSYKLLGSVDQANLLRQGNDTYDVFWFASSAIQQLGDPDSKLESVKPTFITPLVFAGWKSEMQKLGFTGTNPSMAQILDAITTGKTTTWITNPTQSNSGATVFFSVMNYYAGNGPGQALTMQQLDSQPVQDGVTRFSRALGQTPSSTGTLMDTCVANPTQCRTVFTYEALVIQYNQELAKQGKEPLYAVYPQESLAIADAPMGFLPHASNAQNADKKNNFLALQEFMRTGAQDQLLKMGRRPVNSIGLSLNNPDTAVFNPAWGIRADLKLQLMQYPSLDVINAFETRYSGRYRGATIAGWCLDGSGSMGDDVNVEGGRKTQGWTEVRAAARKIFVQSEARQYNLGANPDDVNIAIIFNEKVAQGPWTVVGNDEALLNGLFTRIDAARPNDGTNMYACFSEMAKLFDQHQDVPRKRLLFVLTDGQSATNGKEEALKQLADRHVTVVAMPFGNIDLSQLTEVTKATGGAVLNDPSTEVNLRAAAGWE